MRRKKLMPVWLLILIDLVALGAALCMYALFHHVIHWDTGNKEYPTMNVEDFIDLAPAPNLTPAPESSEAPVIEEEEPVEEVEWGQFGEKFADKFTDGEVISTDTLYVSESIRVELSEVQEYNSIVHIIDIYVRNTTNFRCTFAGGKNDGTRATGLEIATGVDAVCSLNGDFPGFSNGGNYLVLRDGVLYQDSPNRDVCVLYIDGTMKTFKAQNLMVPDFDGETELANGAWQGWCFGPSLLNEDGTAASLYDDYKNPRSVLGYYEPGHYCFIAVDGRSNSSAGMTIRELAAFSESLGLKVAYNMDGGQSSTLTFGDRMVNVAPPAEGVREISDILYIAENTVETEGET